ncbi:putative addiction module component [bacterium BMS3Bbin05]|nr:putative addiction module component [bacterium BMS3Bbin05]
MEQTFEKMTIEEKLKLMEELWSDLLAHEGKIPFPQWHKDTLEEREKKIRNGQESILDWNQVKERIRQSIK